MRTFLSRNRKKYRAFAKTFAITKNQNNAFYPLKEGGGCDLLKTISTRISLHFF
jgi:hypothetical protein